MSRLRHLRLPVLLLLALFAGFTLCGPAFAFADVPPDHPHAAAAGLAARGIVSGRLDGAFEPNEAVSRGQFAKMIVCTLSIEHADLAMPFTDVDPLPR